MRIRDGRIYWHDDGQLRVSTLDYIVTRVRRHKRNHLITNDYEVATREETKTIEDDVDMRLSEDESPMEAEDAAHPTTHHRPPSYNTEDYAHAIAKYARSSNLYAQDQRDKKTRGKEKDKLNTKEGQPEMSLKQFASLPELLRRLREDLKTAYVSFVKELVRDPHDGVSLLLDLLKMIQLAQTNLSANPTSKEQQIALRRALIDEFECLSCLRRCLRCSDAAPRLAAYRNGLYCLAMATMSSLTRSRTIALQLLTKACDNSSLGHRQVIEAFSTLRLRFSEPVRYKFLVSMMLSHPHPSFQVWGLKFVNALVSSADSLRERVYLQEEIVEAGFDVSGVKKALEHRGTASQIQQDAVITELKRWNEGYIDLTSLETQLTTVKSSNIALQQELKHIRQANMKLLEENVLLKAVGGEVEEQCIALKRRLEHHGIPTAPSPAPSVTDSEISSFIATGRSTIKRINSDSPNRERGRSLSPSRTIGTISTVEEGMSISPDWTMVRPSSNNAVQNGKQSPNEKITPVPSKRHTLEYSNANGVNKSANQNDSSHKNVNGHSNVEHKLSSNYDIPKKPKHESEEKPIHNQNHDYPRERKDKSQSASSESLVNGKTEKLYNGHNTPTKESFYQAPPIRGNGRHKQKSSQNKDSDSSAKETSSDKASSNSNRSLSSSTSSLSAASSSTSFSGGDRKDPQYENLPLKAKAKAASEEGDVEYERDVVVYEAITLGNDTIMMDKNSTHSSKNSNNSNSSKKSKNLENNIEEGINVRQSVRHYENLVERNGKRDENNDEQQNNRSQSPDIKKEKFTKIPKEDKGKKKNHKSKFDDVSDGEVEAVMNGLESVLRSAESSFGMETEENLKEIPYRDIDFEDRSSPENPISGDIEIIPSRVPAIPPRCRSRESSSHGSRTRTPNSVLYFSCDSPNETSDTETLKHGRQLSTINDTESTYSFGWHRGEHSSSVRRHETFINKSDEDSVEHVSRKQRLRRSESFHTSNTSEYNSHRSYSPRRKNSNELLESEVHINGRTYTKYSAQEVERKNKVNALLAAEIRRRRNRSIDDRLDRWLDQDCMRQLALEEDLLEAANKQRRSSRQHEDQRKSSRAKNNENKNNAKRNAKSRFSLSDLTAFAGFKNPTAALRESDYGSNFMLTNPGYHTRLGDALGDLVDYGNPRSRSNRTRKMLIEDPHIPTPDYSATPAGTLTNPNRHILDIPSGLY